MTNYEKIKSLSIEQMAKILCKQDLNILEECPNFDCDTCMKKWLKEEAEKWEGRIRE